MTTFRFEKLLINGVEIKPVPKNLGIDRNPSWTLAEIKAYLRLMSPHRLPRRLRQR